MQKHARHSRNGHASPRQVFTRATLQALSGARERGAHVVHSTERLVRLHPAAAVGVAFAGGVVVALLLSLLGRGDD